MENELFSPYYFTIEIDGIQTDRFFSCEGLEVETEVYEIEEGGYNTSTRKLIGRTRYPNLILKKGINRNNELLRWFKNNQNGDFERKTFSVIQMDSSDVEMKRWDFFRAYPCRWKVGVLDANDNSFPIEIIEIAHD